MSTRVCLILTGTLSDDARIQAMELHRLMSAWETFLEALKELPLESSIAIAPTEPPKQRRRRRGRPRLTVAEPPTAA